MQRLYYLGKPGDGYGWGVANTNLVRELVKLCEVVIDDSTRNKFDAPVFVPISDASLKSIRKIKQAPRTIGYCFTEWPLTNSAQRNARHYDLIFCGSEWNTAKLRAAGIKHVATLQQGIDFERFTPQPPSARKNFVVFSGGKYEFRKGQDYVAAVMKHFMAAHGDVVLLAGWYNPWPQSMSSMENSWLIDAKKPFEKLDPARVFMLNPVTNEQTPAIYEQAHVGLFPNRCEAGTNLVLCEFMACQRAVIATDAHGHADVLNGEGPMKLRNGAYDPAGWFNPPVSDILTHLEYAYKNREELNQRAVQCRKLVERFTWSDCARKIYDAAFTSSA